MKNVLNVFVQQCQIPIQIRLLFLKNANKRLLPIVKNKIQKKIRLKMMCLPIDGDFL